jgi:hypothetical protein
LGTTFIVVLIVVVLGFTLAATSVNHLNVTSRLHNGQQARYLADSAISLAIADLVEGGGDATAVVGTVSYQHTDDRRALGKVFFNVAEADGQPYSTNNLKGETSVPGWGDRVVPAFGAHLIGVGNYRGVERRVEVLLTQPPLPFVVGCSGPLRSGGGLVIAGVDESADLFRGLDEADLKPGNLVSNAIGEGAVELGPNTTVTGKLGTPARESDVVYDRDDPTIDIVSLDFESDPEEIPRIPLSKYSPQALGRSVTRTLTSDRYGAETLEGMVHATPPGDEWIEFTDGLVLEGALLYVEGNLRIRKGLSGVGAVVATGAVEIYDGTALSADNNTALAAGGDVSIWGNGASSYFQGLIYTEGNFLADQATLVGTLVARSDGESETELNNANLIHNAQNTWVEVTLPEQQVVGLPDVGEGGRTNAEYTVRVMENNAGESFAFQAYHNGLKYDQNAGRLRLDPALDWIIEHLGPGASNLVSREQLTEVLRAAPRRTQDGGYYIGIPNPGEIDERIVKGNIITIDPSQFLRFENRIRKVLWRRI